MAENDALTAAGAQARTAVAEPAPAPGAPAAGGPDPRERESWFQRLPASEQQRLRDRWHAQATRWDDAPARTRRQLLTACWQGALLFLVMAVLQAPLIGFSPLPMLVLAGGLAGLAGQACGGGRIVFAGMGALAFLAVMARTLTLSLFSPLGLVSVLIATYAMGLLGIDREMRRSGGFDQQA